MIFASFNGSYFSVFSIPPSSSKDSISLLRFDLETSIVVNLIDLLYKLIKYNDYKSVIVIVTCKSHFVFCINLHWSFEYHRR